MNSPSSHPVGRPPVNDRRPVNLQLTTIRFPLTAIASILHRISGVALFFATALILYLLDLSLESPAGFERVLGILDYPLVRPLLWLLLTALLYHFIAGIRHLLLDWGIGESRQGAKTGAALTVGLAAAASLLGGIWIW